MRLAYVIKANVLRLLLFVLCLPVLAQNGLVRITVRTAQDVPIPQATVTVPALPDRRATTDERGLASLELPAGTHTLRVEQGDYPAQEQPVTVTAGEPLDVVFLLATTEAQKQSITVQGMPDPGAAVPVSMTGDTARLLPAEPPTVRDALPLIPGVVRTPEGKLRIGSGPEHRSTLLLNGVDVTDPATGEFGATVPIDSVAVLNVYKSPFLAEYGRFSAGVVAIETKRGSNKWTYELNDPTPELRLLGGRLRGVRGYTPRLNFSGPLIKDKLFYSQSIEYALRKTPVRSLAFPNNEQKEEGWNVLSQFDAVLSDKHLLTATLHGVPQRQNFIGLGLYTPRPTTPGLRGHEYTASLVDRLALGVGTLESTLSVSENRQRVHGQGDEPFVFTPTIQQGNYFAQQERRGRRAQWTETYTPPARGAHQWKLGTSAMMTDLGGEFRANPIFFRSLAGEPLATLSFANQGPYRRRDTEVGAYVQDHWTITPRLGFDAGLRADWQRLSGTTRLAPRVALAWAPFGDGATTFRAGTGYFYDRVPLTVYAFDRYPVRTFNGLTFRNVLGQREDGGALVLGGSHPGNFAPQSLNWNLQMEHRFPQWVRVRASYLDTRSDGLVILRPEQDRLALRGDGRARTRQIEVVSRWSFRPEQELVVSYVRSFARENLNDFANFLGNFPLPVVRPDAFAEATGNVPHRFLAWGVIPFPRGVQLAPIVEWRRGFPWLALDPLQQYAGIPNTRRFPDFFSLDLRVAKDVTVRGHKAKVSFSMFNVTNHWNPDTVRANSGDRQFGEFLGQRPRRYRLDVDFSF